MELTEEQKNFSKRLIIEEIKIFCDLHRKNEGIGEQGLDELADIILNFSKNYISKDKIRERIKHNEEQKNIVESVGKFKINDDGITGEGIEGLNDLIVYKSYEAVINELNYLLEEN